MHIILYMQVIETQRKHGWAIELHLEVPDDVYAWVGQDVGVFHYVLISHLVLLQSARIMVDWFAPYIPVSQAAMKIGQVSNRTQP